MNYVFNLKAHAFRSTDRPNDAADSDRKIRDLQGVVVSETFQQDDIDYVHLFIMTEFHVVSWLKCLKTVILLPHESP